MVVYTYISARTTLKERTFRIGLVSLSNSVATPVGSALAGVIVKEFGYYGTFGFVGIINISCLIYGCLNIDEVVSNSDEPKISSDDSGKGLTTFLKEFFNCESIKGTFRSLFHDSQYGNTPNRNSTIVMMMLCVIVIFGPTSGEFAIMYLYTRFRFNWTEIDYSIFSTVNTFTHLFGTMFSVVIFTKWLKFDDTIVGVISVCSKVISGLIYAFANTPFFFYLGPFGDLFSGTALIAMRSIISKLTSAEELGKVMSVFMLCEGIAQMTYNPMYSAVYKATINTMPSSFFLVGGFLSVSAIFMFL
ncbi:hypothetical protein WDU94_006862 [Cyamophila willieti]